MENIPSPPEEGGMLMPFWGKTGKRPKMRKKGKVKPKTSKAKSNAERALEG